MQRTVFLIMALAFATEAASVTKGEGLSFHEFPVPPIVARKVKFWEAVFSKYGDGQVIIHDIRDPEMVIDLIDFNALKMRTNSTANYSREDKEEIVQKYVERYQMAVDKFASEGQSAAKSGAMEKRVFEVYRRKSSALDRLFKGQVVFRGQGGLADEFQRAAKIANQYLPYMEKIFMRAQLPRDLTRLAFVESMFNLNAKSKVGAAGMWQFMPQTGKRFLIVTNHIDERLSPIRATEAASRYLKLNYEKLKSWPLAITAYNHGAGGIARAVKEVGSENIEDLIEKYQSESFGFASRNFYAEFLAARNIYNKFFKDSRPKEPNPLKIQTLTLPGKISFRQLVSIAKIDESRFRELNPAIRRSVSGNMPLPAGMQIVVPANRAVHIETKLSQATKNMQKVRS